MSIAHSVRLAASMIIAPALVVVLVSSPAVAQIRSAIQASIAAKQQQLRAVQTSSRAVPMLAVQTTKPPRFRPCGELYGADIRELARRAELVEDRAEWMVYAFQIAYDNQGPLPICFAPFISTVTDNESRYLLRVNYEFTRTRFRRPTGNTEAERKFLNGYFLFGHTEPAEQNLNTALMRAQYIQTQSVLPDCRFPPMTASLQSTTLSRYRKVLYSYRPAITTCPRQD